MPADELVVPPKIAPRRRHFRLGRQTPFLVLSGLSMLAGCFALSLAIHQQQKPGEFGMLLGLLGVFNLYEVLVITLGLFLVRRGALRDAGCLLWLELLLLTDAALLYNECLTATGAIGIAVGVAALLLAWAKLMIIMRRLGLSLSGAAVALISADLAGIFAIPAIARHLLLTEQLTPLVMHTMWWCVGALLACHAFEPLLRPARLDAARNDGAGRLRQMLRWGLLALPCVMVVGHLVAAQAIYRRPLFAANLAPLFLGACVYIMHQSRLVPDHGARCRFVVGAVVAAVLLVLYVPEPLQATFNWPMTWQWTPLRMTLMVTACISLYAAWQLRTAAFLVLTMVTVVAAVAGARPCAIITQFDAWRRFTWKRIEWLLPDSLFGWGIAGVVAAFVLLGLGAWTSIARTSCTARGPGRGT